MRGSSLILSATLLLCGCSRSGDWHKQFNHERAWHHTKTQVVDGPRPAGSEQAQRLAASLETRLKECGLTTVVQPFEVADTPRGKIVFRNVIGTTGSWPPKRDAIMLASHYDTKWLPKIQFVGANDGASSTGCLLEIARVLSKVKSKRDFVFVFFDGEEAFEEYGPKDGLYGSRHLSAAMKEDGSIARIKAMVLLDMVGDKDLNVSIPTGDPALTKALFGAAESLGFRSHFSLLGLPMEDDHAPFQQLGVPAVDLIDFSYGPGNAYWHTDADRLENISPRSLEIVGKTVLRMLEDTEPNR